MLHSNESSNVITFAMYFDRFIEHIYKISGKIPMQACNTDSSHSKFSEQNYEVFSLDKHTTHHPEHQLLNDIFGAKSIMADCSSFSFYIHHNQLFIRHSIESKKKKQTHKTNEPSIRILFHAISRENIVLLVKQFWTSSK